MGCGQLARAEVQYSLKGFRIIGVDVSQTAVHHALAYIKKEGDLAKTDFAVADAETLPFRSDCFDVVLCIGTICHLPSKNSVIKALSEIRRATKEKSKIYIPWWQNIYSVQGIEHAFFLPLFDLLHIPRAQYLRFKGLPEIQNILNTARLSIDKIYYGKLLTLTWILNFSPKSLRVIISGFMKLINRFHEKNRTFSRFSGNFEIACQHGNPNYAVKPDSYHEFL